MSKWDDLRVVLEVARAGSVRGAAAALQVNHSTVSRRLAAYEEGLGARLFERVGKRLELTPAGADAFAAAERVEQEVVDVERRVAGGDLRLEGTIRIALPESLVLLLSPALASFCRQYPSVELEVATGIALANLSRRDADVALRIVGRPRADLFGRRVGTLKARAYASVELAAAHAERPLAEWPWLGWDRRYAGFASARWVTEHGGRVVARFSSGRDREDGVRGGLGAGFLIRPHPAGIVAVPGAPEFALPLWLVTHNDLRRVARVRAFLRVVGDHLVGVLDGGGGGSPASLGAEGLRA